MEKEKEAAALAAARTGLRARGSESEERSKTDRKNYTEKGGGYISGTPGIV